MDISHRVKLWTSAGTALLLGSAVETGMIDAARAAEPDPTQKSDETDAASKAPAETLPASPLGGEGEGEGTPGSSGGEFGVDPDEARTNPVVYISALDLIRAHYLAGMAAYEAGDARSAAEMFVHPISEVYVAMEPVFLEQGAEPFGDLMANAGNLALDEASAEDVQSAVDAVMDAVADAEDLAPEGTMNAARLNAALTLDMIERASLQYQVVATGAAGAAYLDGYGFYRAAADRAERAMPSIRDENEGLADLITSALDMLALAYPDVTEPDPLPVEPGQLLGASSTIRLDLLGSSER